MAVTRLVRWLWCEFQRYVPLWAFMVADLVVNGWWEWVAVVVAIAWQVIRVHRAVERRRQYVTGERVLPTRRTQDPIKGVKLAFPVVIDGRVVWHALVNPSTYEAEAEASCRVQDILNRGGTIKRWLIPGRGVLSLEEHGPVPSTRCTCGFYAVKPEVQRGSVKRWITSTLTGLNRRRKKLDPTPGYAVLDVELLGKVLVFTRGYRAERQRVMKARLDARCVVCGKQATGFFAGTFIVGPEGKAALVSTCGCQVPVRWSLTDVRNMAGTEVEWDACRKPLLTLLRRTA